MKQFTGTFILLLLLFVGGCQCSSDDNGNDENNNDTNDESNNDDDNGWKERLKKDLDGYRKDLRANREKLMSRWRITMEQLEKGEIGAHALAVEIADFRREVEEQQGQVEVWISDLEVLRDEHGLEEGSP